MLCTVLYVVSVLFLCVRSLCLDAATTVLLRRFRFHFHFHFLPPCRSGPGPCGIVFRLVLVDYHDFLYDLVVATDHQLHDPGTDVNKGKQQDDQEHAHANVHGHLGSGRIVAAVAGVPQGVLDGQKQRFQVVAGQTLDGADREAAPGVLPPVVVCPELGFEGPFVSFPVVHFLHVSTEIRSGVDVRVGIVVVVVVVGVNQCYLCCGEQDH
mmetsp:Transcript_7765/g.15148  ORF Transcript_7765/g.15148 Transcript_7765/m.15148 type:complete len:210 (+) Transcript_7765:345-974(+)